MMEQIIIEAGFADGNYSAHLPQLTGCVTVGSSLKEIGNKMAELVPFTLKVKRIVEVRFQLFLTCNINLFLSF